MEEIRNDKFQVIKDFSGEEIKLTLELKEEWPDKENDLYTVCKVKDGKNIPLYNETFTPEQVDVFYNHPMYYVAVVKEENYNKGSYKKEVIIEETKPEVKRPGRPSFKTMSKPVYQYDLDGNFIKEWSSRREASRETNVSIDYISKCCYGHKPNAGGYIWSNERR